MASILGNVIESEIEEELTPGVYIAKDGGNGRRVIHNDYFYLVHLKGEAPFLWLGEIVSLPTLRTIKTPHIRGGIDTRDLVIIRRLWSSGQLV